LAEALAADLELIVLGTLGEIACDPVPPSVRLVGVAPSTKDSSREPAMSSAEPDACLAAGRAAVERAIDNQGCRLVIGGEMGIGNSTAAMALACALLGRPASELAGPGTSPGAASIAHKAALIERALHLHRIAPDTPLEALRCVGGFEITALTGPIWARPSWGFRCSSTVSPPPARPWPRPVSFPGRGPGVFGVGCGIRCVGLRRVQPCPCPSGSAHAPNPTYP